jgi:hypothetical protein
MILGKESQKKKESGGEGVQASLAFGLLLLIRFRRRWKANGADLQADCLRAMPRSNFLVISLLSYFGSTSFWFLFCPFFFCCAHDDAGSSLISDAPTLLMQSDAFIASLEIVCAVHNREQRYPVGRLIIVHEIVSKFSSLPPKFSTIGETISPLALFFSICFHLQWISFDPNFFCRVHGGIENKNKMRRKSDVSG